MDYKNSLALGKILANANPSAPTAYSWGEEKFSYADLNDTFRNELNNLYLENPRMAFKLVEEAITEALPKKVMEQYKQFADKDIRSGRQTYLHTENYRVLKEES